MPAATRSLLWRITLGEKEIQKDTASGSDTINPTAINHVSPR